MSTQAARGSSRLGEDEQRPLHYRKIVIRLLAYLLPHWPRVAITIVAMFIYSGTLVALPWIVKLSIDDHITAEDGDLSGLTLMALLFLSVAVVQFVAGYVHRRLMTYIGQQVLYSIRVALFNHIQSLSLAFFDRNEVGKVMSRVQNDAQQLEVLVSVFVPSLASVVSIAGIVAVMLAMNMPLASLTFVMALVLVPILIIWQRITRRPFRRVRTAIAEVNSRIQENIAGVRVVQSLNRQEMNIQRFEHANNEHLGANLQAARYSASLSPLLMGLPAVALALVVLVGGNMVIGGSLEVGVLVAFALYVERLFDPVQSLTREFGQLQVAVVAADRIFELLDVEPEVLDDPKAIKLPPVRGDVQYEGVSFRYSPQSPVLTDIDLHIRPGETVALVGPTGAGKTTLISLLMRFYDVDEGRITVDGHDIRDVSLESLSRQLAIVPQEPYLFSTTIKDNIRYGRPEATDEEVVKAATAVRAHEFISQFENGYDTLLQERGGNLSVGQRQLISFARALVSDPRMLILDEATANIDTETEMVIQEALTALLRGRTALVIAHRLSTVRNADLIVALENGRIVEQGTHDELASKNGLYSRLLSHSDAT